VYPQAGETQLFDLLSDPFELHDVAERGESAVRVERLRARLQGWQESLGDPLAPPPIPGD